MSTTLSLPMHLLRAYVAFTGSLTACTIGRIDHYTEEHRRFLSSGFICGSCKEFLIRKSLLADVITYDAQGNEISVFRARKQGRQFGCPRCGHRWDIRHVKSSP
ncbi:MAG: hypothetical protein K0Q55_98 [Verrucomicrobia bacterium]|jgi:hypothetical protein|nr:hypothetical protein [Verrucomicrobiota bacterium]